jgi:hypothetical protein
MAKAEKKILGILPKSLANVLLVALVITYVVALIWSYVEVQSFSTDNAWVMIIEMLLLAVVVGAAVGACAGDAKPVTLWIAASLAIVGTVIAQALAGYGAMGAGVDAATLGALPAEAFSLSVSAGYVILAIIGAASVPLGNKIKL